MDDRLVGTAERAEAGDVPERIEDHIGRTGFSELAVTTAQAARAGNGHAYFQSSPWASSDLFIALLTGRDPGSRGLVRGPGEIVWRFPKDYPEILKDLAAGL